MARVAELKQVVSEIEAAVGLNEGALMGREVQALFKKLLDVRETLTELADVADARTLSKSNIDEDLKNTRKYLDTVQKVCI